MLSHLQDRILVGTGARDGPREANMAAAVRLLGDAGVRVVAASSLFETQPVGLEGDLPLLNGVVELDAALSPEALLQLLLRTERDLGRSRERSAARRPDPGPRPIDLDLLLHGRTVLNAADLTLPHPRLHLRRFVLAPLAEIAPDLIHPLLGKSIATLLAECPDPSWVRPHLPASLWCPPCE